MFSSNWKTSFDLIDRQYVNWTMNTMDNVNAKQFSCELTIYWLFVDSTWFERTEMPNHGLVLVCLVLSAICGWGDWALTGCDGHRNVVWGIAWSAPVRSIVRGLVRSIVWGIVRNIVRSMIRSIFRRIARIRQIWTKFNEQSHTNIRTKHNQIPVKIPILEVKMNILEVKNKYFCPIYSKIQVILVEITEKHKNNMKM